MCLSFSKIRTYSHAQVCVRHAVPFYVIYFVTLSDVSYNGAQESLQLCCCLKFYYRKEQNQLIYSLALDPRHVACMNECMYVCNVHHNIWIPVQL